MEDCIEVKLSDRTYAIMIENGLRHRVGELAKKALSPRCRQLAVISNSRIFAHYGVTVIRSLTEAGFIVKHLLIGDGERYKTLATAEKIFSFLIESRLERNDAIIALGGGIIGDIAGFVAASYLRGIDFIQIPTTLLAQVDSSIGGKTGVNHKLGKNLIGAFHQPKLVIIDPETLKTLPTRELRAAMQEAIKYGVIADADLFDLIEANLKAILKGDTELLREIIKRSCQIKAGVVSRDERESGERRNLNFGHTIGHALEAASNYRRFKHGEAVGYGIIGASKIAQEMNLLATGITARIERLVRRCGPLPKANNLSHDDIMQSMTKDKKSIGGRLIFVLPDRVGHVIIRDDVPLSLIHHILISTLNEGSNL